MAAMPPTSTGSRRAPAIWRADSRRLRPTRPSPRSGPPTAMRCSTSPRRPSAEALRTEKAKVLAAVHTLDPRRDVVRGQYGAGQIGTRVMPAYRQEPDVAANSGAETYVALKLAIDNWRWAGVPFYLRT